MCAPLGICVVSKTMNTLRRSLVHVKTKLPNDKGGGIYCFLRLLEYLCGRN